MKRFVFGGYETYEAEHQVEESDNNEDKEQTGRIASSFYQEILNQSSERNVLYNPTKKRIEMYEQRHHQDHFLSNVNVKEENVKTTTTNSYVSEESIMNKNNDTTSTNSNVFESNRLYHCQCCDVDVKLEMKQQHDTSTVHLLASNSIGKPKNYYHLAESNRGYVLLKDKYGWSEEQGLGKDNDGRIYPLATTLKNDKLGIGKPTNISKITHTTQDIRVAKKKTKSVKQQRRIEQKSKRIIKSFKDL